MYTPRKSSLDGLGLGLTVVQIEVALLVTESGGQTGEDEGAKPILIVSVRGLQSLNITAGSVNHVETKGSLTEDAILLKYKCKF